MSAVVAVDGLAKRWSPTSGLLPVTFSVAAGELVVVRGRSGSGKSTLLALLAGWCAPDAGTGVVAGARLGAGARRWAEVAVVPQVLALVPELTVRENVADGCAGDATVAAARVDAVLGRLDLGDLADRPPTQASMGQQQRAAVARAVVARAAVLLADEPTSHQDAGHGAAVVAVLRDAAGGGGAVLVASHDPEVARFADRVIDLGG